MAAAVLPLTLVAAACSQQEDELTVMVAASMCSLAESAADETHAAVVCGGSADLVAQLESGHSADLLITANQATADAAQARAGATQQRVIATNELVLVVPAGNPAEVTGLDESLNGIDLVICAPQVPCGAVSSQVAAANNIELTPVSEEQAVTDVLGKVVSGQADAGLVYQTDAQCAGTAVEVIPIPKADEFPNAYVLLTIGHEDLTPEETAFLDAFTDDALTDAGFTVP